MYKQKDYLPAMNCNCVCIFMIFQLKIVDFVKQNPVQFGLKLRILLASYLQHVNQIFKMTVLIGLL